MIRLSRDVPPYKVVPWKLGLRYFPYDDCYEVGCVYCGAKIAEDLVFTCEEHRSQFQSGRVVKAGKAFENRYREAFNARISKNFAPT